MDYTYLLLFILAILLFVPGWVLDRLLGDPTRGGHPIIIFGELIALGEKKLNRGAYRRIKGLTYNLFLSLLFPAVFLLPIIVFSFLGKSDVEILGYLTIPCNYVVFYMLSGTTLIKEVQMVFQAVNYSLEAGRKQVSRIVGRDTQSLSEHEVRTAALETLSENLSDGVIAPMFWFAVFGPLGMLMYKMINTQDSMIGYKNERYREYGWFSAKLDDVVNYIPARLTAVLMLLSANRLDLIPFVKRYGRAHASPNSGYPESALAGILNCRFGGAHDYFGEVVDKPYIGESERPLTQQDLDLAIKVNRRSELLMGILVILLSPFTWLSLLLFVYNS